MYTVRIGFLIGILLAAALVARPAFGQTAAMRELRERAGFSDGDVRYLDGGRAVVKVPDSED
ncbi:MAG TPA: hypothetical protein VLC48_08400, partial [Gemmatimonadota bacterium]|nr:hypothetical protein [Gemmatimonadota bacterium]